MDQTSLFPEDNNNKNNYDLVKTIIFSDLF